MSEEPEDIDRFLYGDEAGFVQPVATTESGAQPESATAAEAAEEETAPADEAARPDQEQDEEADEEEEDDDDLEIVFGAAPSEAAKRGPSQTAAAPAAKPAVDVNAPGMLNNEVIYNVELDSLPEKPWRQPGADITDYFNYGFTEQTWREYCAKQKGVRDEYGAQKRIAVFDGSLPFPFPAGPAGALRPPMLPPGMPPFPLPAPGGAGGLPFPFPPPFMFPGLPPPPIPDARAAATAAGLADADAAKASEREKERPRDRDRDREHDKDKEKDRDDGREQERESGRRSTRRVIRRSPPRSRSRSRDRDSKRRR